MSVYDPCIELVFNEQGIWVDAYALDGSGERAAQLPLAGVVETMEPNQPGVTSIQIHSFRVKRTTQINPR